MYKKPIIFLLTFFSILCFGQSKELKPPDYDSIERNIKDKKSEYYYPEVLKKLKANDTLITENQFHHLYFGYIFQKEYNPYKQFTKDEELFKYYRGEFEDNDFDKVINLLKKALNEFPIDLRAMNFLSYMYHISGNEEMANKVSHNFHGLLKVIIDSGDGFNCESAFHVISVSHEYVLLNLFDIESISQSFDGKCDFLEFEKDRYKIPGLYFNISKLQEKNIQILNSKH